MEGIIGRQPDPARPVLFLDFDDVVNVFGRYREYAGVRHATVDIGGRRELSSGGSGEEVEIAWNEPIVSVLRDANAVWCTSWKSLTQEVLNPALDLDFGFLDWKYRGPSDYGEHGKAAAIAEAVRQGGFPAFAVADDSMGEFGLYFDAVLPEVPHLVIAPKRDMGLTLPQVEQLSGFLSQG